MTVPGSTIAGRYELVRQLGAGAMGSVWLARDTALGREVAVKSVRGPLVEDEEGGTEGEQRAMREARMIARVNHPSAVAIYDVAVHEGHPWLVMEYVESRNLAELVGDEGPLAPRRAAEVGSQVAAALADVHQAGIVHRDVKPANVLISRQGSAKITDFGIARGGGDVTLTTTGTMWGTPAYFAPEVAGGATPSPKSDVWSLGASLYFAVEGSPPFGSDESPLVLLGRIANQPVPSPQQAGSMTPVLERLLDRDPDSRPTMAEAADLLAAEAERRGDETWAAAAAPAAHDTRVEGDLHGAARSGERTSLLGEMGRGGTGGASGGESRRRRSAGVLVGSAVVVLVVAAAAAWLLLDLGGGEGAGTATEAGQSESAAPSPSPQQTQPETQQEETQPETQPEETQPESPPQTQPETQPETQPPSTPAQEETTGPFTPATMRQTITSYYAMMPEDTEAGFQRLGPSLQQQGFDAYDDFWDGIESVSVSDVEADPANRSATATVVFVRDDGTTSTERHRFGLVPSDEGDSLLINTDSVI